MIKLDEGKILILTSIILGISYLGETISTYIISTNPEAYYTGPLVNSFTLIMAIAYFLITIFIIIKKNLFIKIARAIILATFIISIILLVTNTMFYLTWDVPMMLPSIYDSVFVLLNLLMLFISRKLK